MQYHSATGKTAKQLFAPESPATTTRERIVETALNLFYGYGFHAVGLDQIIAEVGVTKTTFYNHFESKDDLAVEAIKLRDSWEAIAFSRRCSELAGDDPHKLLLAVFDVLDEWFTHPDYTGCLFIKACAEFPAHHHPVHLAAMAPVNATQKMILEASRALEAADPEGLAIKLALLAEGALPPP